MNPDSHCSDSIIGGRDSMFWEKMKGRINLMVNFGRDKTSKYFGTWKWPSERRTPFRLGSNRFIIHSISTWIYGPGDNRAGFKSWFRTLIRTYLFICMSISKTELISTRFRINKSMWSVIDIMLYLFSTWIEKLNWDLFSLNNLIFEFKTQSLLSSGSQWNNFERPQPTISVTFGGISVLFVFACISGGQNRFIRASQSLLAEDRIKNRFWPRDLQAKTDKKVTRRSCLSKFIPIIVMRLSKRIISCEPCTLNIMGITVKWIWI